MDNDEGTYFDFANNLIKGYYSPPAPDIDLWCGPGYPLLLVPFLLLGLPLISITLFNALLQYLSIVFLFKSLIKYVSFSRAFFFSIFWALCFSCYVYISLIHTETLTWFLIAILSYGLTNCFDEFNRKYIILTGVVIGYIALTKIIFGYVMLVMLIGTVLHFIILKSNHAKKGLMILLIGFAITMPYLTYTYHLTGRIFYWGNSGGMSLYWMSTPIDLEYGDWNNESFTSINDSDITGGPARLSEHHLNDIHSVNQFKGVEKDDAYKAIALRNIKSNPTKYVKNILSNLSRAFFGFPHSYSFQRPFIKIWYFAILYAGLVFSLVISVLSWNKLPYPIQFILLFVGIYFGGSLLVSMENRMFVVIIPALLFWSGYVISRSVKINLNMKENNH